MLCFLTVKIRLERSVTSCYHGSKISRSQKSFWGGRKVRARNALAIRKRRDWANTIYFTFTQVLSSCANFSQQMKALRREKSSISTGILLGKSTRPEIQKWEAFCESGCHSVNLSPGKPKINGISQLRSHSLLNTVSQIFVNMRRHTGLAL